MEQRFTLLSNTMLGSVVLLLYNVAADKMLANCTALLLKTGAASVLLYGKPLTAVRGGKTS